MNKQNEHVFFFFNGERSVGVMLLQHPYSFLLAFLDQTGFRALFPNFFSFDFFSASLFALFSNEFTITFDLLFSGLVHKNEFEIGIVRATYWFFTWISNYGETKKRKIGHAIIIWLRSGYCCWWRGRWQSRLSGFIARRFFFWARSRSIEATMWLSPFVTIIIKHRRNAIIWNQTGYW